MANFVVRVELHNATRDDYEKLHRAMELTGFSKSIVGLDGIRYDLPPAEYHLPETMLNGTQVHTLAKNAANNTGRINEIVVTDSKSIIFSGLQVSQPAANAAFRKMFG